MPLFFFVTAQGPSCGWHRFPQGEACFAAGFHRGPPFKEVSNAFSDGPINNGPEGSPTWTGVVCAFCKLNYSGHPSASSIHPVSVPIHHPRQHQALWSQSTRQGYCITNTVRGFDHALPNVHLRKGEQQASKTRVERQAAFYPLLDLQCMHMVLWLYVQALFFSDLLRGRA